VDTILVYSPQLAGYDLGPAHPLRPERFTLTVALMEAYGLVPPGTGAGRPTADDGAAAPLHVVAPFPAADEDLLRVHDPAYVDAVRAGVPSRAHGLGTLDTPVFPGMHEAAALVAGATLLAVREVASERARRAFSVAGGLHHAHRSFASGFCVYNDCAVGIAWALASDPAMRVLYIDIDAHHGDGVQEAFYAEPRVLTVSLHQNGRTLFPGTGWPSETGEGAGTGAAVNVPLPAGATDACYRMAFDEVVEPHARAFATDLIVAQCGADALHGDPLTDLGLTVPGHQWLVRSIVRLADELCEGRLVALGGGGYDWADGVPRAWTLAAAELAGVTLPTSLPEPWRERVSRLSHTGPPRGLLDDAYAVDPGFEARLLADTLDWVAQAVAAPSD